jgi:hypothetical protein
MILILQFDPFFTEPAPETFPRGFATNIVNIIIEFTTYYNDPVKHTMRAQVWNRYDTHFVSFCLILPHFVSFCFILFRFVSFCFILFRFVSFCLILSDFVSPVVLWQCRNPYETHFASFGQISFPLLCFTRISRLLNDRDVV